MMEDGVAFLNSRTLDLGSLDGETGQPPPPPAKGPPISLGFFPHPCFYSPMTYISQYPKSYKLYMNITYKGAASFPG